MKLPKFEDPTKAPKHCSPFKKEYIFPWNNAFGETYTLPTPFANKFAPSSFTASYCSCVNPSI